MKQRLLNILFWSVISAAFIGPGTIATAASAGAGFGYLLMWALVFSTIACMVLQESSARITTVSGKNLGEALRIFLFDSKIGRMTVYLILTAILLGCAAFETGNILGAVAGVSLIFDLPAWQITIAIGVCAFTLFWFGSVNQIAKVMGLIVAFMGLCFLTTAIVIRPPILEMFQGAFIPTFPVGSEMLILALIGTTVVPYNLFLGSGIPNTQSLSEMRLSLTIAIGLGGIISIAVMVVGASIAGIFTFESLANELAVSLGSWAAALLGLGLFAAGFSSAVTAPLAAAITARSMLDSNRGSIEWKEGGLYFRFVWMGILMIGIGFGIAQVQPIPAIILAQALNGVILPLVAVFLLIMVNNVRLMNRETINSNWFNLLMGLVVFITVIIGISNLARALTNLFEIQLLHEDLIFYTSLFVSLMISWPVWRLIKKVRIELLTEENMNDDNESNGDN